MKGLDISFSMPSQQWWEDRRAEGFDAMVQNLWTGGFASNDGIKRAASTNLRRARLAGYITSAYANASPPDWWPLKIQMDNIKANAGAEWGNFQDTAVDVEIPGVNIARVMELANGLETAGKEASVLYTARWFWLGHMGDSQSIAWRRFRLWSAHYDWNPDIDFGSASYGPWAVADLVGEQYAGTTNIEGQSIDLNNFISDWPGGQAAPVPEPPVEEDPLMGKILDLATAFGRELEAEIARAKVLPKPIKGDTGATGPAGPPGPAGGGTTQRTYTVKSGDTLGGIANEYSGVTWQQIYETNKATIGPNPNLIQPGQVLIIP